MVLNTSINLVRKQLSKDVPIALIGPNYSQEQFRNFLNLHLTGYLPYSLSPDALLGALRILAAGETYYPIIFGMNNGVFSGDNLMQLLTGRERDVLVGLLGGHSNKEMARKHDLSEVTIKHHLKSLRGKLGAKNRTHAVCRAIELGLTGEDQLELVN